MVFYYGGVLFETPALSLVGEEVRVTDVMREVTPEIIVGKLY